MNFSYLQACPTCGAPVELDETDRIIRCPYCEGRNYLLQRGVRRFTLPYSLPPERAAGEVLSFPYLRFKGQIFTCQGKEVAYRVIDTTQLGTEICELPLKLGLRPQAMKLLPLAAHRGGRFFHLSKKVKDIFVEAARINDAFSEKHGEVYHRAYIGESVSVIYLPTLPGDEGLLDAVLNREIPGSSQVSELEGVTSSYDDSWQPQFIPLLCPHCGGSLEGARDSLALHCRNCVSVWREMHGRFARVDWSLVAGNGDILLPFWKLFVAFKGVDLKSLADFLRLTNHPVVIREQHEQQPLAFWIPGFKVRPHDFLKIAKNLTFSEMKLPKGARELAAPLYPVTLSTEEAGQSVTTVMAHSVLDKKKFFPRIQDIGVTVVKWELVYLPFTKRAGDFLQIHTGCVVNSRLLEFGRTL